MKLISLIVLVAMQFSSFSQDSARQEKKLSLAGYVKDLAWLRADKDFRRAYVTNLVHNRVNLRWKPGKKINGRLEVRNRLYWGDEVKLTPQFAEGLKNGNESMDLSVLWLTRRSTVLHTNVERAWLEFQQSRWNLRAGRQRINWGMVNTWNPNDIFNSYNFLDFDYEERPGSDAVKFQYLLSALSNIELAFATTDGRSIAAVKFATNYREYDLQWTVGSYREILTAGFGWAGSLSELGFKGELQFYARGRDSASQINATIETDYITRNGWYLASAILFNQRGRNSPVRDWTAVDFQASPRNLMPAKWNILAAISKEFTPRFQGSLNIIYSPGMPLLIIFPSLRYNLATNLDLDFFWQSFFSRLGNFQAVSHTAFLRLKWNY